MNESEKFAFIGGGVGPYAADKMEYYITSNTKAKTDQEHVSPRFMLQLPISDRTDFLLGRIKTNPAEEMLQYVVPTIEAFPNNEFVIGIPCITFHAEKIMNVFRERLNNIFGDRVQIMDMMKETIDFAEETLAPSTDTVGLLSTTGTRKAGNFKEMIEESGLTVVEVAPRLQKQLHEAIYQIKTLGRATGPVKGLIQHDIIKSLERSNSNIGGFVWGCTELCLPFGNKPEFLRVPAVDSLLAGARAMIQTIDPSKLKTLKEALDPNYEPQINQKSRNKAA
jgi:aspartate racemase